MPQPPNHQLVSTPSVDFAIAMPGPHTSEKQQKAEDESVLLLIVRALTDGDTERARSLALGLQHKDHITLADDAITTHEKANAKRKDRT